MDKLEKPKYPYVLQAFIRAKGTNTRAAHEEIINSHAEELSFMATFNTSSFRVKQRELNRNELKDLPPLRRLITAVSSWVYNLISIGLGFVLGKIF